MPTPTPIAPIASLSMRLQGFQQLMPYRIREVLLVSSRYDSFILEEEGHVTDLILQEFERLNLHYAPRLTTTPSAREAMALLESERRFDMIIVTMHPGEMDPADFARRVRRSHPKTPIVLLGYDNRELQELMDSADAGAFDRIFVWTGDARILLAIVKLVEDERNVEHDTKTVGVDVIILIEDSVHFVSAFLPLLFAELMKQSQRLLGEGVTISHKVLRMRARPKVLLASSYEQARSYYERYRRNVLGVISDVRFRRHNAIDPEAGIAFARFVHADNPDVPILLQSTEAQNRELAEQAGAAFLHKESPQLKQDLEHFVFNGFGFGPFIFRLPDGHEVGRANNLEELREQLCRIPPESLQYHSDRDHFSAWLKARTEFRLAARLRPKHVDDYASLAEMREAMIEMLDSFRREAYRDTIVEFDPETFGTLSRFARIGGGNLGGKARGLAFLNTILREHRIDAELTNIEVVVPPTVVLGTEVFDRFMESNRLADSALIDLPDEEIRAQFLDSNLPRDVVRELRRLLRIMDYPIAVRSSSLLEDSQHQPFAGVYETYMLANAEERLERRLTELLTAIKLVYASTFSERAKAYLDATPQRPEKEKMAVIIQRLVGRMRNGRFYPNIAGVAQSYNYYPFGRIKSRDGAASVVLGLGRTVAEGRGGLRFCPRYPRHLPQMSSVDDILNNAQKTFDALPMSDDEPDPHLRYQPRQYSIGEAATDGTLDSLASTYSHENHAIYDGTARDGTPVITFAGVLKHDRFPLAQLLDVLLHIGKDSMSTPVELEFAVDLDCPPGARRSFACLQLRPLSVLRDLSRFDLKSIGRERLLCESPRALGNGRIKGIRDIVFVHPEQFQRKHSRRTATELGELNAQLRREGRPYLLIGPGRWGSADPWLGIPVNWSQIAGARIIVETGFSGTAVTPSDGSHFFHNIIAFHVGYLTTNPDRGEGFIDWPWLLEHEVVRTCDNGLRWVRLDEEIIGLIDGESRSGILVKSEDGLIDEPAAEQTTGSADAPEVERVSGLRR
jgi:CheY-like chemotaxis protein